MALLSWLPLAVGSDGLALGAEHGIVKAAQVQRVLALAAAEAELAQRRATLLAAAEAEAECLRAAARAQAESLLAQAEERVAAACRQARDEATAQAVHEWHARRAEAAAAQAGRERARHDKMAAVVVSAVERIVGAGPREALFARALAQVQALAREGSEPRLRVHPQDEAAARRSVAELPAGTDGGTVQVEADPALEPGSCIFETDTGCLDASLGTQLRALQAALARAAQRAAAQPAQPAPEEEP